MGRRGPKNFTLGGMNVLVERIAWDAFTYYGPLVKVKAYLSETPSKRLTLKSAADLAGMESCYFSRYFRARVGVTFKFWIDYTRVQAAIDLFRAADISIIEAGPRSGFEDQTTMARTFRRITGVTPREFRAACRRDRKTITAETKSRSVQNLSINAETTRAFRK